MNSEIYNLIYESKDRSHLSQVCQQIIASPNSSILEIGSGTGLSSIILFNFSSNLTLIEPNTSYFQQLSRLFFSEPTVSIHNSFVDSTPLIGYDHIFSVFNVINHIPSDQLDHFFDQLRLRALANTTLYFDCYNGDIASSIPFKSYEKTIGNSQLLSVTVNRVSSHEMHLQYSLDGQLIDNMPLYLHTSNEIETALTSSSWSFCSNGINGRYGDPLFLEYFCKP